jgi:hypothetical protein
MTFVRAPSRSLFLPSSLITRSHRRRGQQCCRRRLQLLRVGTQTWCLRRYTGIGSPLLLIPEPTPISISPITAVARTPLYSAHHPPPFQPATELHVRMAEHSRLRLSREFTQAESASMFSPYSTTVTMMSRSTLFLQGRKYMTRFMSPCLCVDQV